MTIDDQIDCPIVGEAGQGLARGLDPRQLTRMKRAHASRPTYKIFTKVIITSPYIYVRKIHSYTQVLPKNSVAVTVLLSTV